MNITAITVSYNTKVLLQRAVESLRRFHPTMPLIIVDNSDRRDPCREYVYSLAGPDTKCIQCDRNIGHGPGMDLALHNTNTTHALIFDSDIEIIDSPVSEMMARLPQNAYGIGYIETTAYDGYEYGAKPSHEGTPSMRYLHPYFQLISVAQYMRFHPYVHHGAPCYLAMLDIHKQGLSEELIKEFPGLGHTGGVGTNWTANPNLPYVRHNTRGTRDIRLRAGQGEIEPGWILNRGLI